MKTALITGSNGFIGKHLKKQLEINNYQVTEFNLKQNQDVSRKVDFDNLPAVDVVFHLAALSGYKSSKENTNLAYAVNVMGTINVLEYCQKTGAKCIFPSTYVYDQPYEERKNESCKTNPTTAYSFTKFLGEELCRFYSRVFKVDTLILRTANVYGPDQDEIYIVPVIAKHLMEEKALSLTRPEVERSFIYIDDLVEAYVKLATAKTISGDVFNVGPDRSTTLKELVELLTEIIGRGSKISFSGVDRPQEADINRVDNSKVKQKISWTPKTSLKQGLTQYCEFLLSELK